MQQTKKYQYLSFDKMSMTAQTYGREVLAPREAGTLNQAEQKLNLFLPHPHYHYRSWGLLT